MSERVLALWMPDWGVLTAAEDEGIASDVPVVLTARGEVFAANAVARALGVRRGLRIREAQERAANAVFVPYREDADHRRFEPLIRVLEGIVPSIQQVRPGLCLVPGRGPARYYGSEAAAAEALTRALRAAEVIPTGSAVRIGAADGVFAAQQAAYRAVPVEMPESESTELLASVTGTEADALLLIPAGCSARFLAPMPVTTLGEPELSRVLARLGVHRLGELAALPAASVRDRFGAAGEQAHRIASGEDPRRVRPRVPPAELAVEREFDPPLERADQAAFGFRASADRFLAGLAEHALVVSAVRIEIIGDRGGRSARSWLHPRHLDAGDVVDRVRWQLQGAGAIEAALAEPVALIRVIPETLAAMSTQEPGLWGGGPDTRVYNGLTRLQGMVGHDGVLTARIGAGREPRERQSLVPWGERDPRTDPAGPWPGSLPGAPPQTVLPEPMPARVIDAAGESVAISDRDVLSAPPRRLQIPPLPRIAPGGVDSEVRAWAGPWPVITGTTADRVDRFQLLDERGHGWLVRRDRGEWWAEARYD
ncbi:DNA polymerase Y family protein [Mycetocola tolaasinivorans]|uniref:DNA polymerase Y family protein n=1 Tax=Mycetocola tolaasinivorans TaxID=76635 RepID=A0A3L7ADA5_9MICO|nr:DNA polymerase Y family protein [Mycetocola tolaasinivorans]RLP77362.1 DNA polymerase Y family protein [Mycetocola tolaasinivorans]